MNDLTSHKGLQGSFFFEKYFTIAPKTCLNSYCFMSQFILDLFAKKVEPGYLLSIISSLVADGVLIS